MAWSGVDDALVQPASGARLVRRVRTAAEADEAHATLSEGCARVRLAPFVEGIPCGVNALVFPDGVAVGPVLEMVVLRTGSRLRYFGSAGFWQPPAEAAEAIRGATRRIGAALGAHLGYRGAFTVDGVLAADGFWPTEINARPGEGLSILDGLDTALAPTLLSRMLKGDAPIGMFAAEYEAELLAVSERRAAGYGRLVVERSWQGDRRWGVVWTGEAYALAVDGEAPDAEIWAHAMQPRGFLRIVPDPDRTPRGPSVAPRVVAGLAVASQLLDLDLGPFETARESKGHR